MSQIQPIHARMHNNNNNVYCLHMAHVIDKIVLYDPFQGGEVTCQLSSCLDCEAQFRHCALEVFLSQTHKINSLHTLYSITCWIVKKEKQN